MHLVNTMSPPGALKSMLSSEAGRLSMVVLSAVISVFSELIAWICLYQALHAMFAHQTHAAGIDLLAMGGAIVVRYGFSTFSLWQSHVAAYHIIQRIRQCIVTSLAVMSPAQLQRFSRGDLEKRLTDDSQALEPLIAHHTTDVINGLLLPLLLIGFLMWIDWRLGLLALAPLPLAACVQTWMMRGFSSRQDKYNKIVAGMHQAQLEFLRSIGVMKLFSVDSDSYRQLNKTMTKHHKLVETYTKQMVGAWIAFVTLAQTSLVLVIPFAISRTMNNALPLVDLAMVTMLCAGILKPWLDLTQLVGHIQTSLAALKRLVPLFPDPQPSPTLSVEHWGDVEQLSANEIGVERGGRKLLTDVTLCFQPGDFVVFQGESGSGKSSLLATLYGAVEPTTGGWSVNGHALSAIGDKGRSALMAVVDQSPTFFRGTLRDNVALANPSASDQDIMQLLSLVGLDEMVTQLPSALLTDIGETQRSFSGGEMQRLAIVRAALSRAPILILDEATSHLDSLTEQRVLLGLRHYAPQQIQLVITHRPHALTLATHCYQLSNGSVNITNKQEVVYE